MAQTIHKPGLQVQAQHKELPERRGEERTATVLQPALLEAGDFRTFCLVKNISGSGLKARVFAPLEEGGEVRIRLNKEVTLSGHVVWYDADELGIAFTDPVDIDNVISRLADRHASAGQARSPRLDVLANARFAALGQIFRLELLDISSRGIKCEAVASMPPIGEPGTLTIDGLPQRKAVLRWSSGTTAGFFFLEPIGFAELGQWIMERYRSSSYS